METKNNMRILCECNSWVCDERIEAPIDELNKVRMNNQFVIAKTCLRGPVQNDVLIEERETYSVFKE